jgi:hypothetical protein
VDALIFLSFGVAIVFTMRGSMRGSTIAFAVGLILTIAWFKYHLTDPLKLGF